MSVARILYAVPKAYDPKQLTQDAITLRTTFPNALIVTSEEAWRLHGGAGFPTYIEKVAAGKDYADPAQPAIFDLFIVPINDRDDPRCGKATAQIVERAKAVGKRVLAWDGASLWGEVTGVTIDMKDWQTGGHLAVTYPN